ncbi:MAG: nucleotidyltransferase domain-containing protein [Pirellulaceae bacterium]
MPNGSIDPEIDYVAELSDTNSRKWPTIAAAYRDANEVQTLLDEQCRQVTSDDYDLVVFGSLARREWTSGSDVDWTLLLDGQANADHRRVAGKVECLLKQLEYKGTSLKPPGGEGVFGKMAFSHEIVHHIGGEKDTNRNTTQRILLLLEATAIAPKSDVPPFERIRRQILSRYLSSDSNFHARAGGESRIPRFLLNDIVRYWRTMCVDFAYKDWEQAGKKWALRNIKLRMSRKLLFVSGLLTVFSCFKNEDLRRLDCHGNDYLLKLQAHLLNFVHATPLNIIAWTLSNIGLAGTCVELLERYENFLTLIDNSEVRARLTEMSENDVYEDKTFLECREISHEWQRVLRDIFFEANSPLREFTFEYGVF